MNISLANLPSIDTHRVQYLSSLPYFQDYYLEYQIPESDCYILTDDGHSLGYAIVTASRTLIELHLVDGAVQNANKILLRVTDELDVDTILCKSFDGLLLSSCIESNLSYTIDGLLFRHVVPTPSYPLQGLLVRLATPADVPWLLSQSDEIFSNPEEVVQSVAANATHLFQEGDKLIGCGFLTRIHSQFNYFDLGMWVHPNFRRMGYATRIVSHLKQECLASGFNPACGCAYSNSISIKTLGRNGFYAKHLLLSFNAH